MKTGHAVRERVRDRSVQRRVRRQAAVHEAREVDHVGAVRDRPVDPRREIGVDVAVVGAGDLHRHDPAAAADAGDADAVVDLSAGDRGHGRPVAVLVGRVRAAVEDVVSLDEVEIRIRDDAAVDHRDHDRLIALGERPRLRHGHRVERRPVRLEARVVRDEGDRGGDSRRE
jgi:hypothetical protein